MTDTPRGILLLHAWWGRNAVMEELGRRFEAEGYVVEAPDLYGGTVVATREEAQEMVDRLDSDAAFEQINNALTGLRGRLGPQGKVAVVAFSLGVWFSLWLSEKRPGDVDAVVVFYGTYHVAADQMKAPVLAHLASDDEFEPRESVSEMEALFAAKGVPLTATVYPETRHWFFERDRPEYDAGAAAVAWDRTLGFLRETLNWPRA